MTSKKEKLVNGNLQIKLKNVSSSIANAIRRSCMAYTKCFAFSEFNIKENTSPIINEYLINRLRLIPINSQKVKGNEKYSLKKYSKNESIYVMSDDIKPNDGIEQDIIISELKGNSEKHESLDIEMSIKEGMFKEHSSFDTCLVKYKKINDKEFELELESRHKKPLELIYKEGIEILINILENFISKVEITEIDNMYSIIIPNEDQTLGNLLKVYIMDNYNPEFVGFIKPHPLEDRILLKIKLKDSENIKNLLKKTSDSLITIFKNLL